VDGASLLVSYRSESYFSLQRLKRLLKVKYKLLCEINFNHVKALGGRADIDTVFQNEYAIKYFYKALSSFQVTCSLHRLCHFRSIIFVCTLIK
jgi:hypothetical protein